MIDRDEYHMDSEWVERLSVFSGKRQEKMQENKQTDRGNLPKPVRRGRTAGATVLRTFRKMVEKNRRRA